MNASYPRRLIEVDLPIRRISAHARREKSIRHGHISTLHIWWARRPLAACRAVICAALWPDPADPLCPQSFRDAAARLVIDFAKKAATTGRLMDTCSKESFSRWETMAKQNGALDTKDEAHLNILRFALLDFIADFANWDNSTVPEYLETARALTQTAHEALGGEPGTRPLVVDPFAGGGSIPLEALRVGADAFASDLNPVAVLLNKVVLEYIPKYGQKLADEVRKWGQWIKEHAEKKLAMVYPQDSDGSLPVTYLWARRITCEGPGCGAEVPLIRSLWLAKKGTKSVALRLVPRPKLKRTDFEIIDNAKAKDVGEGTVRRGSATCPVCGFTTPVTSVRRQLKEQHGGADSSSLLAVVCRDGDGKTYRTATKTDLSVVEKLQHKVKRSTILPPTELPLMSGVFNVPIYGISRWDLLFSARQLLIGETLAELAHRAMEHPQKSNKDTELAKAVKVCLLLALGKYLDFRSTLCAWITVGEKIGHTFGRQALGMIFDWAEGTAFGDMSGSWDRSVEYLVEFLEKESKAYLRPGTVEQASAQANLLPNNSVQAFVTDPPYYNAVPYADLSDFFYLWLRKGLKDDFNQMFSSTVAPKDDELCEMSGWDPVRYPNKDAAFYERGMRQSFAQGKRLCVPSGVAVVVFAHKTTQGWESLLSALIESGWIITGSWPVDTERSGRLRAMESAALASSVHLVCRPREHSNESDQSEAVGDWRDMLNELPNRIHDWMPRLASEGIVGADAIFACLGPALEIFSRHSRVEKADGTPVPLKDYLEHVWAAVSKEALGMIFAGADATGFEPDARLTAMWLWTLGAAKGKEDFDNRVIVGIDEMHNRPDDMPESEEADDEEPANGKTGNLNRRGFFLEYDAARKIAQGLGAHLEQLTSIVEVKGDTARLLPVSERAQHLFGKDEGKAPAKKGKKPMQRELFDERDIGDGEEGGWGEMNVPEQGNTTLDRIHQSMILFAAGRSEALKRFLVEEGVGQDTRFWRLAQALSALYPSGTEEKRWVDGVLARKKGLGF